MSTASMNLVRAWTVALVGATVLTTYACTTDRTPTGPSPAPAAAAPAPAPAPSPTATSANVTISVKPNPVPFSGQPITDAAGCAGSANTWFYDQVLTETNGVFVQLTHRVDMFDGRMTNDAAADIRIPAGGTTTVKSRWCSVSAVFHTAQTTFTGKDDKGNSVSVTAGQLTLMGK